MANVIAEFFGLVGVDPTPPATMAELIPWLLTVVISVVLVSAVFRIFGKILEGLITRLRV